MLRPVLGAAAVVACLSIAACKDSAWTPMGSAELVLSQIKLGGVSSVAKRFDSDESFARSMMNGIATGDSLWLEVASNFRPGSATAEASLSIALASALPRSPSRVLALLGEKYALEQVCGIPFLRSDSARVATYYDTAAAALSRVHDTALTKRRDGCRVALDTARNEKLARIDPAYLVKNKPAPPPPRPKKRPAKKAQPATAPDSSPDSFQLLVFCSSACELVLETDRQSQLTAPIPRDETRDAMRLLVVDDDSAILKLIARVLRDESYAIDVASTGEEARMLALVNEYDGIILDLQLGDRHGFEILQELRRSGRRTPVLLYSGLSDTETIVRGLDAGADDYVVKPVSNEELRARVRTLVRRGSANRVSEQVTTGNLTLNRLTRRVTCGKVEVDLTSMELKLLEHLMLRTGETVSRSELHDRVWDMHFDPSSNVIDAHVARLRKKLDKAGASAVIATRRGIGFVLEAVSPTAVAT
jgi:DNA-binding response OmpR family regulator